MLNNNYIEKLVGFKDIILEDVKDYETEVHIFFKLQRKEHFCPECNHWTSRIHDYRIQPIKDVPMFGKKVIFHYRKRRYFCPCCGKRFFEKNSFLPRYHRMTRRLINYIITQMQSTHSMTSIAHHCNLSVPTVFRIFNYVRYVNTSLPRVLSIDEFKGNAGNKKYQCILTDPKRKKVLDILEGREHHILSDYFRQYKDRKNVEYFVMDMWQPYKDIAETYFKNATIVIDKYHFIRQVLWAFDRVRKDEQKKFYTSRRKYFKRSRFLLLKRMDKLKEDEKHAAGVMLDTSSKLRNAYLLKEKFYEFIDCETYESALKKLKEWYLFVSTVDLPEFNKCMQTIINWQEYILNSFKCPYTNGYTEGVNNKIKVLKRNAYGVRNFSRFRTRILHMMN